MADVLAEAGGVKLTVRMAGIAAALLTLALFAALRAAMNKKRAGEQRLSGGWADCIGFGLLPAMAVWKTFETLYGGAGRPVIEPLPLIPGVTENGRFVPCMTEAAAAILCFAGICIWLMIRREELQGAGEVPVTAACLWAGVRIVTESLREPPDNTVRYICCAVIAACLAWWTYRQKGSAHTGKRMAANWAAAAVCAAMIVLTASGTLSVGSEIGDLAVLAGCAVLLVLITLLCGGDSRTEIAGQQEAGAAG